MLTAGGFDREARDKHYAYSGYQNENSNGQKFMAEREKESLHEVNHRNEYENSWFYLIFRLNLIRKKYEL